MALQVTGNRFVVISFLALVLNLHPMTRADDNAAQTAHVTRVLEQHAEAIMAIEGVVGVGQGECDGVPCIRVFADSGEADLNQLIPEMIDGVPVVIEVTGPIKAL